MAAPDHTSRCHVNFGHLVITINLFSYLVCHSSASKALNGGGFSVELIRRNSPNSPFYNQNKTPTKSLNRAFRRLMEPSNPITPQSEVRRDFDGEHLMKFSVGTPPVDIYGVADTGSTLLWTQCEPCLDCYKQKNPKFDPRKSSTYSVLTCAAQECYFLMDSGSYCPSNDVDQKLCSYNYSYVDGATTGGLLAKETITLKSTSGNPISLENIVIGCGHNNTGETFQENQMGVVGLGIGNMSFISQIAPWVGGKRFSYCLVPPHSNPTTTSKMSFGNGSEVLGDGVVSTSLISEPDNNTYAYRVTLEGMSVGDKFVLFNSSGNVISKGNTILDSGTPNTYLPQQFYDRLVAELKKQIPMSPIEVIDPTFGTQVCYNTGTNLKGPNLTVHFEDGANLQLTPTQIFYQHQEHKYFCFVMQNSSYVTNDEFVLYGNYAQSNFWIGLDQETMVVSFKPTDCTNTVTNSNSCVIASPFLCFSNKLLILILIVILFL